MPASTGLRWPIAVAAVKHPLAFQEIIEPLASVELRAGGGVIPSADEVAVLTIAERDLRPHEPSSKTRRR